MWNNCSLDIKLKLLCRSRYILAVRYVLDRIIGMKYEKGIVYERPLAIEIPEVRTEAPIDVKIVSIEDIKRGKYNGVMLAFGDDRETHQEALDRLRSGDVCFIAVICGTVVGFSWLYFRRIKYEQAYEREMEINGTEALIYNLEVFKQFRKSGVSNKLNEKQLRYLKSKNYKKALVIIKFDNIPSIKSFERLGFMPIKYLTNHKIFFVRIAKEDIIR